jgi:hypothetical protein
MCFKSLAFSRIVFLFDAQLSCTRNKTGRRELRLILTQKIYVQRDDETVI